MPASYAQTRMWFIDRLERETGAYGIFRSSRLSGPLDTSALRRAFTALVELERGQLHVLANLLGRDAVREVLKNEAPGVAKRPAVFIVHGGYAASAKEAVPSWPLLFAAAV